MSYLPLQRYSSKIITIVQSQRWCIRRYITTLRWSLHSTLRQFSSRHWIDLAPYTGPSGWSLDHTESHRSSCTSRCSTPLAVAAILVTRAFLVELQRSVSSRWLKKSQLSFQQKENRKCIQDGMDFIKFIEFIPKHILDNYGQGSSSKTLHVFLFCIKFCKFMLNIR